MRIETIISENNLYGIQNRNFVFEFPQNRRVFSLCNVFLSFSHRSRDFRTLTVYGEAKFRIVDVFLYRNLQGRRRMPATHNTGHGRPMTLKIFQRGHIFVLECRRTTLFRDQKQATPNVQFAFRNNIALFEPEYLARLARYERFGGSVEYQ